MNVRKFSAKSTRECLRMMRDELGDDAMILSSKQTGDMIEMVAMSAREVEDMAGSQPTQHEKNHVSSDGKIHRGEAWQHNAEIPSMKTLQDIAIRLDPKTLTAQNSSTKRAIEAKDDNPFEKIKPSKSVLPDNIHPPKRSVIDLATTALNANPSRQATKSQGNAQTTTQANKQLPKSKASFSEKFMTEQIDSEDINVPESVADQLNQFMRANQQSESFSQRVYDHIPVLDMSKTFHQQESHANQSVVLEELKNMRQMLEGQLAGIAWRESIQRHPTRARIWQDMVEAGFSAAFARVVVEKLPNDFSIDQARIWLHTVLQKNLQVEDEAVDLVEQGGVYALIGPTGVGKTTTTAKLAARCVVKWGVNSLGLITTDSYRIGAHDQLRIYGKILGVPVYTAHTTVELHSMLSLMTQKKLILIDTVGMGQHDERVPEQLTMLSDPQIQRLLLLNASAQAETLEDVAQHYAGNQMGSIHGTILTKLDEAVKTGPALDTAIRHKLKIHFITTGQRVPEDIHTVNANLLLHKALKVNQHPVFVLNEQELDWKLNLSSMVSQHSEVS